MSAHTPVEKMTDGRWVVDSDVVAYITDRGLLYCSSCAALLDVAGSPVYLDSAPHNTEPCDRCHKENTK